MLSLVTLLYVITENGPYSSYNEDLFTWPNDYMGWVKNRDYKEIE